MPPLFIQGKKVTEMAKGSQALGLIPDVKYIEDQVELKSGDYFFIYSDGLSEARNNKGTFYGESKIFSLAAKFESMTAKAAGKSILDDVTHFTGGSPQSDDMSLIILKRL
jgi:sigma-B regulation protein RsbU (phosphoserine phosphatase)